MTRPLPNAARFHFLTHLTTPSPSLSLLSPRLLLPQAAAIHKKPCPALPPPSFHSPTPFAWPRNNKKKPATSKSEAAITTTHTPLLTRHSSSHPFRSSSLTYPSNPSHPLTTRTTHSLLPPTSKLSPALTHSYPLAPRSCLPPTHLILLVPISSSHPSCFRSSHHHNNSTISSPFNFQPPPPQLLPRISRML